MKSVIITGATGCVGRFLLKVCIDAGYEVLAVVHRESPRSSELDSIPQCHVLRLNLDEYDNAFNELTNQGLSQKDYEIFFHLAWMAPFGKDRDNLFLQLKNIEAALSAVQFAASLGCSTFVGIGSQAEYGRVQGILSPDTPTFPETGYGITKLCAGQMTRLSCEQSGLKHIWCRVLSAYGPYDRPQTIIRTAVTDMMQNLETEFSPCEQMWEYIYAEDAARAILLSAQKGEHGRIYMVSSGETRRMKDFIKDISLLTGYTKEIGFGKRPYNDKQVMHLQSDISSLEALGFSRRYSFNDGIQKMIEYNKRTGVLC